MCGILQIQEGSWHRSFPLLVGQQIHAASRAEYCKSLRGVHDTDEGLRAPYLADGREERTLPWP